MLFSSKYNKTFELNNTVYLINEEDKTASIFSCESECDVLFIPHFVTNDSTDYLVTRILPNSFRNNNNRSIEFSKLSLIPSIERKSFYMAKLRSITLPPSVTRIGEKSFYSSKVKIIQFPSNSKLRIIEKEAFMKSTIKKISFPKSLQKICKRAFYCCNDLSSVKFPYNSELTTIEEGSFDNSALAFLTIPKSVTNLENGWTNSNNKTFKLSVDEENPRYKNYDKNLIICKSNIEQEEYDSLLTCWCYFFHLTIPSFISNLQYGWCSAICDNTTIQIDPENKRYKNFDDNFIIGKSNIDQENYDVLIFCMRNVKRVTIPSFIKTIAPYAFNKCYDLEEIKFPKNIELQTIDDYSFSNTKILHISIPPTVTRIGKYAFSPSKLQSIVFPKNSQIQIIDDNAFSYTKIKQFSLPASVTFLGKEAFNYCHNLSIFDIPSNSELIEIKDMTFCDTSIETIKIPSKIIKIGNLAFFNCDELTKFEIQSDSELKIIEKKALALTKIEKIHIPKNVVDLQNGWCMMTENLNNIDIDPENHRYKKYEDNLIIGKSSLINEYYDVLVFCTRNAKRVIVPSFIKIIASYAFNLCNKLKSIEFPSDSQIETIEKKAMYNSSIQSISFPCTLKKIDKNILSSCTCLQIIEINNIETFLFFDYQTIIGKPIIMVNVNNKAI